MLFTSFQYTLEIEVDIINIDIARDRGKYSSPDLPQMEEEKYNRWYIYDELYRKRMSLPLLVKQSE